MKNVVQIAKLLPHAGKHGRKLLNVTGKASGYFSAVTSWAVFIRQRNAVSFVRASMNTGLAVGRIHPVINISMSTLDAIGLTERAFKGVEGVIRSRANKV